MHELSLCQDLLRQVTNLARQHQACSVASVKVQIGQLAGVEPELLASAFTIARAGTVADAAEILTELVPPRVLCVACDAEADVTPSCLRCPHCGSENTRLVCGDELILARVELERED